MLVSVVNHNNNRNAVKLIDDFKKYCCVYSVDSGSDLKGFENVFELELDNVYYTKLLLESLKFFLRNDEKVFGFVCSDIVICDCKKLVDTINDIFNNSNIGVYSPSSTGRSLKHCKNFQTGDIRDVPFVEGFCFFAERFIIEEFMEYDFSVNKLGWGLDVLMGFLCQKNKMRCVIDDRIVIEHFNETGYSMAEASKEMYKWHQSINDVVFFNYWMSFRNEKT